MRFRIVSAAALATGMVAVLAGAPLMPASASAPLHEGEGGFNHPGNVLIADQFNNRIVEVDSHRRVVWQFGNGSSVAGPTSVVGPNDAERIGSFTLIAGTGTPAGADPSCADPNGCADNRVFLVDAGGHIVWQYGKAGVSGAGFNQLNTPVQATALPNFDVLITDQANERVIEVTPDHRKVWQYGQTGVTGTAENQLNNPNSAQLLKNGHILIADENNNRVIEVNREHDVVWSYGSPSDTTTLNGAAFASRLDNGDTLITDSNNNRIVEVNHAKQVVWSYSTSARPGSIAAPAPTRAVRLDSGHTLISDQFNDQVIEVDHAGHIVFTQGHIQLDGTGFNQLNAPYDAKVIGDFTGLTPPPGLDD
jgi:hypothetical protein